MVNVNMLSPNLASAETAVDEFYYQNVTVSRSSDWAADGTYSLKVYADAANAAYAGIGNASGSQGAFPVSASTTYTFVCTMRSTDQTTVYYHPTIVWFNASDTPTYATAETTNTYPTAGGVAYSTTATSPSGTVKASVIFTADSALTIGTSIYFDKIGFWEGSDTTWAAPTNLLSWNQRYGTDPSQNTTGWWASTGDENTLSSSTAEAHSGTRSLACTAVGTLTMYARSNEYESTGWACSPGDLINLSAWSKWGSGNTTTQSFYVVLDFYDSGGTFVETATAQAQTIVSYSASWQQSTLVDYVVPAGVAKMGIRLASWGSITAGKIVHWDDVILTVTASAPSNVTYSRRLIIG